MGLVGYSDSEGSDSEDANPLSSKTAPATGASGSTQKPRTDKVVSGNKIRVSLPGSASTPTTTVDDADNIDNDRPVKRARTSGVSSGINSFLPAPKNPAKTGGSGSTGTGLLSRNRGAGLSKGISLKTGATPAFSRHLPEPSDNTYEDRDADGQYDEFGGQGTSAINTAPLLVEETQAQEAIPARKAMMFKPLSVGRKPKKKSSSIVAPKEPAAAPSDVTKTAPNTIPPPKKKSLLFSSVDHESATVPSPQEYQPEFTAPAEMDRAYDEDPDDQLYSEAFAPMPSTVPPPQQPQGNDLQSLASTLNLTKEQRRQLFGRDGAGNAKLASFNLAQEYSSNNALMQDEASQAPLHNPVRAIAPGKHSLQQLLNSAQNQKEALEESFARGKANKAAAGTKYGW